MDQQPVTPMPPQPPVSALKKHYRGFWFVVAIATVSAIVGGILVWMTYNLSLTDELNSLIPMRHVEKKSDTLSGWKTYTNSRYDFEVRYPITWDVKSSTGATGADNISFYNTGTTGSSGNGESSEEDIFMSIYPQLNSETVEQTFNRVYNIGVPNSVIQNTKSIAGIDGVYFQNIPGFTNYDALLFIHNKNVFDLEPHTNDQTFNLFISSFKFTK